MFASSTSTGRFFTLALMWGDGGRLRQSRPLSSGTPHGAVTRRRLWRRWRSASAARFSVSLPPLSRSALTFSLQLSFMLVTVTFSPACRICAVVMVICRNGPGEAPPLCSDLRLPSDAESNRDRWRANGHRGSAEKPFASIAAARSCAIPPERDCEIDCGLALQGCRTQPAAAFLISYLLTLEKNGSTLFPGVENSPNLLFTPSSEKKSKTRKQILEGQKLRGAPRSRDQRSIREEKTNKRAKLRPFRPTAAGKSKLARRENGVSKLETNPSSREASGTPHTEGHKTFKLMATL